MKTKQFLHLDMDAYFASIEQRDNPFYQKKPVIVCHTENPQTVYGVVSSASYEARKYGVKSGLTVLEAKKLCPDGVYLKANYQKYLYNTKRLVKIAYSFTDLIEVYSVDEIFLDVTNTSFLYGGLARTAYLLKKLIKQKLNLTASIGGGANKYIAKMASELHKPNGITIIAQDDLPFIWLNLPVKKLIGVGRQLEKKLKQMGVTTIRQLLELPDELLSKKFGVVGLNLKKAALGLGEGLILPREFGCSEKSFGHSLSLRNVSDLNSLSSTLLTLCDKVTRRMRSQGYFGRTLTLRLGLARMFSLTKSQTVSDYANLTERFYPLAKKMLYQQKELLSKYPASLIGISVSNIKNQQQQLTIYDILDQRYLQLSLAVDKIKDKYGEDIISRGSRLLARTASS